jgi:hypothetical protein
MATFGAQMTEIEYLVLHGKPRAKKQGIDQARVLLSSLARQKHFIEESIASRPSDAPDLAGLRDSLEQLQTHMRRLDPFLRSHLTSSEGALSDRPSVSP